ncbi:hypothetical protein [Shinella pollutisoli]|uniref:Uncharacterized protein n=1 Tax=Shinella pollutisoli TaxID=2250594 RepID=A0ABV7DBQ8_9HYPH|nr:hypothetical protein [Shinella pollutisoli]
MNIHIPEKKTSRRTKVWTEEHIAIAEQMWAEGYSGASIGERFGVSRGSVTAMACMYRDRFPSRVGSGAEDRDEERVEWLKKASALWMEGKTAHAIAVATGISSGAAYHRIKKQHPELFPAQRCAALVVEKQAESPEPRSYIGNGRWVDRVPYTTLAGSVVTLPRVSMINGTEA